MHVCYTQLSNITDPELYFLKEYKTYNHTFANTYTFLSVSDAVMYSTHLGLKEMLFSPKPVNF